MAIGVGIDVSKDKLDAALSDGRSLGSFPNSAAGLDELVAKLRCFEVLRVVLEASGGYERLALATLHAAGFVVVRVQPARARHFARAIGRRAKTDSIDALVLAKMAITAVGDVEPWRPLDAALVALRGLVERRLQLVTIIDAELKRRRDTTPAVLANIEAFLGHAREALAAIERQIDEAVRTHEAIAARVAQLESVRGVGRVTATSLLVGMPELGRLNRREVAALAGVAPLNRDSGTWSGARSICGGRRRVRSALYMATLAATRWNPIIRNQYAALVQRGKPKKLALVACMRKLLIHLNALCRAPLLAETQAET
jgi:transposase